MITDDFDDNFPSIMNLFRPDIRPSTRADGVIDFLISEYNTNEISRQLYRPLSMPNIVLPFNNLINPPSEFTDILAHTLTSEKPKFKKVISERGMSSLKKVIYDQSVHKQEMCPITQTEFNNGDHVTELPCGHYFDPDAIDHWLKHEKAECPVCRMMLDNDEVENTDASAHDASAHDASAHDASTHDQSSLVAERTILFDALSRISNTHPFGPRPGMEHFVYTQDDEDLQGAIIRSLLNV